MITESDVLSIAKAVSEVTGVDLEQIRRQGRARTMETMATTAMCYYLSELNHPNCIIAEAIRRNEATVRHYLGRHRDLLMTDTMYQRIIENTDKLLKQDEI